MIIEAPLRAAELTGGTALVSSNRRTQHQLPMVGTRLVHVGYDGTPDALREAVLWRSGPTPLLGVAAEGFFIDDEGIDESASGGGLTSTADDHRDRLDATEERFRIETRALGGRARLVKEEDHPSVALARHACGADWLIARRLGQVAGSLWVPSIADLVMSGGVPVLLLAQALSRSMAAE